MTASLIGGLHEIQGKYDAFVFDQFGVLHNGTDLYPNVLEVLNDIKTAGKTAFVLSNSGKTEEQNLARIHSLGIPRDLLAGAVTSGDVARFSSIPQYLKRFGQNVLHLAGPNEDAGAIRAEAPGIRLVDRPGDADFVYLSGMPEREDASQYRDLLEDMLNGNLPLLCSNPDFVSPRPDGLAVSPGSIAAEYGRMGGDVDLVGKPYPAIYETCLARIGVTARSSILFIGDSYHHDIAGAASKGFDTLMLLGGVHRECFEHKTSETEILAKLNSCLVENEITPNWLARNL